MMTSQDDPDVLSPVGLGGESSILMWFLVSCKGEGVHGFLVTGNRFIHMKAADAIGKTYKMCTVNAA
jgi:hypothetical protein